MTMIIKATTVQHTPITIPFQVSGVAVVGIVLADVPTTSIPRLVTSCPITFEIFAWPLFEIVIRVIPGRTDELLPEGFRT